MASLVTPAFLDELIARCARSLSASGPADKRVVESILGDLESVRDHLVMLEHHDLAEWIRDLPPERMGEFLADIEVTARQASTDADIGSFISALAAWQTSAEAARNGW